MVDHIDVPTMSTKLQNTLIQYHSLPEDKWSVAKKSNDVTVWRKPSEEFGGCLYKIEGVVQDVTNKIVDYIRPGPYRLQWDSLMTTMEIIKDLEQVSALNMKMAIHIVSVALITLVAGFVCLYRAARSTAF